MIVAFYTHETKRGVTVREPGWVKRDTHHGVETAAPRKEDIVLLDGKRHVVIEVQWSYARPASSIYSIATAHAYLWSEA